MRRALGPAFDYGLSRTSQLLQVGDCFETNIALSACFVKMCSSVPHYEAYEETHECLKIHLVL